MIKRFKKFPVFLKEVKEELKKVKWSTRKELYGATVIVMVVAASLTAYIFLIDAGLANLIRILLK